MVLLNIESQGGAFRYDGRSLLLPDMSRRTPAEAG